MPEPTDGRYFEYRAAQAREMAERATSPAARRIHLELAADYDQKAREQDLHLLVPDSRPSVRSGVRPDVVNRRAG
ncbi:hypothetical protein [Sphingomonas glacialis]|uniref:hypothetical protein n=1 Tax=Sphingomonas glacialis TaxID=658225 RepID=UPI00112602D0|nr:hypothetical protein [Sphingomonas glacialis]